MPVAMNAEGVTYYLGYDQVGSLRIISDSAGNVIKSVEYDSFGNILSDSNPAFAVPFGFAGGLHDRDSGLVRFGYRDYDPDVGRWTAKDPILFAGGDTDLYGYVLNDPINWVDPWGFFRAPPFGDPIGYDTDYGGPGSWDTSSLPTPDPMDFTPSQEFLQGTQTGALIFGTALSVSGNLIAGGAFYLVGGVAQTLESALYSDSQCDDAVVQSVQTLINTPYGTDPITDKVIQEGMEYYMNKDEQ